MINPTQIDHICLLVNSIERSQKYYERLFDFSFKRRLEDPKTLIVESENVHFFITELENIPEEMITKQHISFEVDHLNEIINLLKSESIEFKTGEVNIFKHKNYKWCEWRDPNGIRVECVEIIKS
jgi:catechol 2,3-dioxygenase-like lactoylglutathione lyase family enzyme